MRIAANSINSIVPVWLAVFAEAWQGLLGPGSVCLLRQSVCSWVHRCALLRGADRAELGNWNAGVGDRGVL